MDSRGACRGDLLRYRRATYEPLTGCRVSKPNSRPRRLKDQSHAAASTSSRVQIAQVQCPGCPRASPTRRDQRRTLLRPHPYLQISPCRAPRDASATTSLPASPLRSVRTSHVEPSVTAQTGPFKRCEQPYLTAATECLREDDFGNTPSSGSLFLPGQSIHSPIHRSC